MAFGIPDFSGQGASALRAGMGIGQGIMQSRLREEMAARQAQQDAMTARTNQQTFDFNEQVNPLKIEAAELRLQTQRRQEQANAQAQQREQLANEAILLTMAEDIDMSDQMLGQLMEKYGGENNVMMQGALVELAQEQDIEKRNTKVYEFLNMLKEAEQGGVTGKSIKKTIESPGGITKVYSDDTQEFVPWGAEKTAADREALENTPFALSAGQKDTLNELDQAFITSRNAARSAATMADRFKAGRGQLAAGWSGSVDQTLAQVLGTQDAANVLRTDYTNFVNRQVVDNLPPGVASDKDIEMVRSGFLPENASPQQIEQWLRAYSNVKNAAANYEEFQSNYFRENGGTRGTAKRDINVLGIEVKKGERMDDAFKRFNKKKQETARKLADLAAERAREQAEQQANFMTPGVGAGTVLAQPGGMVTPQQTRTMQTGVVDWSDL